MALLMLHTPGIAPSCSSHAPNQACWKVTSLTQRMKTSIWRRKHPVMVNHFEGKAPCTESPSDCTPAVNCPARNCPAGGTAPGQAFS